jgi:hypothetical protein
VVASPAIEAIVTPVQFLFLFPFRFWASRGCAGSVRELLGAAGCPMERFGGRQEVQQAAARARLSVLVLLSSFLFVSGRPALATRAQEGVVSVGWKVTWLQLRLLCEACRLNADRNWLLF